MKKVLVIAAHRDLSTSRISRAAVEVFKTLPDVTVHELAQAYPDGVIDVPREQALLVAHDAIVWLFPFWWYSSPAILKAWQDDVLTYGFAYGNDGTALHGKPLLVMTSTGGRAEDYQPDGYNRYPVTSLLLPFHATANLTGMVWQTPALLQGANNLSDAALAAGIDAWTTALSVLQQAQ